MISIENLSKSYGDRILFEQMTFRVNRRERIGLVGRNGHGKTTLFRMITGAERTDSGAVLIPKNYRIGYVKQTPAFSKATALEEGIASLPESFRDHHWEVEKILSGLGFSPDDMARHPDEFSGGYQVRLELAKTLLSRPDLLLLDEPTNYLDIASIRWVERFLLSWPGEVIVITHDRSFMDRVITHVVGIHRRKARKVEGNTEKYYAQILQEEEVYEKTRINDVRKRKEIEQFISRFRAKARLANLVQSRIKTLAKMEKREKLEEAKDLDFVFHSRPFRGRQVLRVSNLSFGYRTDRRLIENFNLNIQNGERICLVGPNGRGKTTLLKILAGQLLPDTGEVVYNPQILPGFYEQGNVQTLTDSRTVEEEIAYAHPDVERQQVRNICGAMLFEGDEALKKISVLSGGEKSRVMLGKLIATPTNLLLLDEPTNHLDMEACDALLAAIDHFPGAVIMVTHNEMFLHAIADRLVVFQDGRIDVVEGRYAYFLERFGWNTEKKKDAADLHAEMSPVQPGLTKKELRKKRSEITQERSRALNPLERKIAEMESGIESRESSLLEIQAALQKASETGDAETIAPLSKDLHRLESEIDQLFSDLDRHTRKLDQQKSIFEKKLLELESAIQSTADSGKPSR